MDGGNHSRDGPYTISNILKEQIELMHMTRTMIPWKPVSDEPESMEALLDHLGFLHQTPPLWAQYSVRHSGPRVPGPSTPGARRGVDAEEGQTFRTKCVRRTSLRS